MPFETRYALLQKPERELIRADVVFAMDRRANDPTFYRMLRNALADLPDEPLEEVFPLLDKDLKTKVLGEFYRRSRETSYSLSGRNGYLRHVRKLLRLTLKENEKEAEEIFNAFKDQWGLFYLFHNRYTESTLDIDLSNCHFILTANTLETVPPAVINRCEVVFLDRYSVEEKIEIAQQHLIRRLRQRYQISEDAGCKTLIIPRENLIGEEGIERLPESLKRELQILTFEEWKGDHEPFDYSGEIPSRPKAS
jgi:hypothetical protein